MNYVNLTSWVLDSELPSRVRDRTHRIALHEARIATEVHHSAVQADRSWRSRFRFAGAVPAARRDVATCCA